MKSKIFFIFSFFYLTVLSQTVCFTLPNITPPTYTPSPIPTITYTVLAKTTYSVTTTEQTYSLTMSAGGSPYLYFVAYTLKLPDTVKANAIIVISTDGEVTNNYGFGCGVVSSVVIANSATDSTGITIIAPRNGADILDNGSNGDNHLVFSRTKQYLVPSNIIRKYINVCVYAYSTSASTGNYCTLMQGYGHLEFTIYSP